MARFGTVRRLWNYERTDDRDRDQIDTYVAGAIIGQAESSPNAHRH